MGEEEDRLKAVFQNTDVPAGGVGFPCSVFFDFHVCPASDGPKPHLGGVCIPTQFKVFAGWLPIIRKDDPAICIGPLDKVSEGVSGVEIEGKQVARLLASCQHGGKILGPGRPTTLITTPNPKGEYPRMKIQGDKYVTEYNEYTSIEGGAYFQLGVVNDLDKLYATKTGKKLQEAYKKTGKHTTIMPIPPDKLQDDPHMTPTSEQDAHPRPHGTGNGSDSVIYHNPTATWTYTANDGSEEGRKQTLESWEILGHEQIHALHAAQARDAHDKQIVFRSEGRSTGLQVVDEDDLRRDGDNSDIESKFSNCEEMNTIIGQDATARKFPGCRVPGVRDDGISEAALLRERNKLPRSDHDSVTERTHRDQDGTLRTR